MSAVYMSSALLLIDDSGVYMSQASQSLIRSQNYKRKLKVTAPHLTTILEIYSCRRPIDQAYSIYHDICNSAAVVASPILSQLTDIIGKTPERTAVLLADDKVYACPLESLSMVRDVAARFPMPDGIARRISEYIQKSRLKERRIADLTELSRADPAVARTVQSQYCPATTKLPDLTREQFIDAVNYLFTNGFLTVPVGAAEFGSCKRLAPICHDYGFTRGTPIDRYYLGKFLEEIRSSVVGETLEIGGVGKNRHLYGFTNTSAYRALDMHNGPGIDLVGDIHDPRIVPSNSLDSVIIFNVLEHCQRPWVVVENIYQWLREGGRVFCMVPNAQRVHRDPQDYWRILPDGMESLFAKYSQRKLFFYGNPIAVTAAMMGIAAEELSDEELNSFNDEYPVATCLTASK